jgi:hypothetical protein
LSIPLRDRFQQQVAARWSHRDAIGILDETNYRKKGRKTPGVKRQYCGALNGTSWTPLSFDWTTGTIPFGTTIVLQAAARSLAASLAMGA